MAAQLDAYLLKYDAYQDNRKNSDVIYDVKRVEAKQEQDRQKRIQFIKDMAAVTIYVFLGFGVLFLLYKGFRRYQGTAPIFVKNQEADQVAEVEMSDTQFNLSRAKAAQFTRFSDEARHKRDYSANASFVSVQSTQEPARPEDYERQFESAKRAKQFNSELRQTQVGRVKKNLQQSRSIDLTLKEVLKGRSRNYTYTPSTNY